MFTLRPIESTDFEFVVQLENAFSRFAVDSASFLEMLEKASTTTTLACLYGKRVGFSIHRRMQSRTTGRKRIYLDSLVVHPKYRRRGIGSRLMTAVLADLTTYRDAAETHVDETQLQSLVFLRENGWIAAESISGPPDVDLIEEPVAVFYRMLFRYAWLDSNSLFKPEVNVLSSKKLRI